jgi:hypothetical protein
MRLLSSYVHFHFTFRKLSMLECSVREGLLFTAAAQLSHPVLGTQRSPYKGRNIKISVHLTHCPKFNVRRFVREPWMYILKSLVSFPVCYKDLICRNVVNLWEKQWQLPLQISLVLLLHRATSPEEASSTCVPHLNSFFFQTESFDVSGRKFSALNFWNWN